MLIPRCLSLAVMSLLDVRQKSLHSSSCAGLQGKYCVRVPKESLVGEGCKGSGRKDTRAGEVGGSSIKKCMKCCYLRHPLAKTAKCNSGINV